jgi:hypothetical protein
VGRVEEELTILSICASHGSCHLILENSIMDKELKLRETCPCSHSQLLKDLGPYQFDSATK